MSGTGGSRFWGNNPYAAPATRLYAFGGIVAIAAPTIAGLLYGGFFPLWSQGASPMSLYMAMAGAGFGLVLHAWRRVPVLAGILAGAVIGAGAVLTLAAWLTLRSRLPGESILRIEIIVALIIGAVPGIALYRILASLLGLRDAQ